MPSNQVLERARTFQKPFARLSHSTFNFPQESSLEKDCLSSWCDSIHCEEKVRGERVIIARMCWIKS
jgi:hypothetical protein